MIEIMVAILVAASVMTFLCVYSPSMKRTKQKSEMIISNNKIGEIEIGIIIDYQLPIEICGNVILTSTDAEMPPPQLRPSQVSIEGRPQK